MIAVPPRFAALVKAAKLRHFKARELLYGTDEPLNSLPPEHLWPNITPTAIVLDELRERLGVPLRITSGYRSPKYNKAVGGSKNSQHMQFRALDFQLPQKWMWLGDSHYLAKEVNGTPEVHVDDVAREAIRVLKQMRGRLFECPVGSFGDFYAPSHLEWWRPSLKAMGSAFRFLGGLGQYPTFTHIDTRGTNAFWTGGRKA